MSEPIFIINKTVLDSADMSADITSEVIDLSGVTGYAVHSIFTGSPDGSLQILGSNFEDVSTFISIDSYTVSAAGKRLLNVEKKHYRYILVKFLRNSGSGSLTTNVSGSKV